MNRVAVALLLLVLPLWALGCAGQTGEDPAPAIEGSAFITFYTDT